MANNSIPIGILNNQHVMASELPEGVNGLNCGCLCPQCHKPLELVNRQGKKYFRHKGYENHCHFEIDSHTLKFIWELLKDSGFLETFGLTFDDLEYFRAGVKIESSFNEETQTSVVNNENVKPQPTQRELDTRFKLTIKNKLYSIKLIFKTGNKQLENNTATIDVGEIIKAKGDFVTNKMEVLEGVKEKLGESLTHIMEKEERLRKQREEEAKKREAWEDERRAAEARRIENEKKIPMLDIKIREKGPILRYYEKKCPICGGRTCSMKMKIGASVACENYPECNYGVGNYYWK